MKKSVVLAYSGGLDTTYCAIYLQKELGLDVHAVTVNTGGFSESERKNIQENAYALGVKSYTFIDETESFYQDGIRYLIAGNILKNNTYPLSVSAERVFQAKAIAEYAAEQGAEYIAHGSTGAGNDQIRFDIIFQTLCPDVEILTPIRDLSLSREEEIQYLIDHGVERDWRKSVYSINQGLWGTSVGGKETLTSISGLPEEAWPDQITKNEPETVSIQFEKGEPVGINGVKYSSVETIQKLEKLAAPFGIGRDIHVGDTIIGIKGRVGFQATAAVMIIKAHHALEKHTLSQQQLMVKDQLSLTYGNLVHEGKLLDPVVEDIQALLKHSQRNVTGTVFITCYPRTFSIQGIESKNDMMSADFGHYGEENKAWTADDVKGFTKITGNQTKIYYSIHNRKKA
jgi:argininosuccinate synthase